MRAQPRPRPLAASPSPFCAPRRAASRRRARSARAARARCSARRSKDAAAALRLISEGADPDCVDEDGWSPLIFASCKEELDGVAARLVTAGAKLDLVSKRGDSALIRACIMKRVATALLLVEAGAALNLVGKARWFVWFRRDKSALDRARERDLAVVAATIRARGGRTAAELKARK
jgi:ankyrin repeat protein